MNASPRPALRPAAPRPAALKAGPDTVLPMPGPTLADAETAGPDPVVGMLKVMDDLCDLLREENELLSEGLPAKLSLKTERKVALTHEYSQLREAMMQTAEVQGASRVAGMREQLLSAAGVLDGLARENTRRIEVAITASRRRINAVMQAIRDVAEADRPYCEAGVRASGPAPTTRSYEA
ncbi:hypothetical protein [Radicibacter daui]|uniref:hypothetical protein n=1 Tax=Radicibacter daui TaxID=3064829 RepID=UPI004046F349